MQVKIAPDNQPQQFKIDTFKVQQIKNPDDSPYPLSTATKFSRSPAVNGTTALANQMDFMSPQSPHSSKFKSPMPQVANKYSSDDEFQPHNVNISQNSNKQILFSQEDYATKVQVHKLGCIEKFFYGKFNSCVRYFRIPIIIISLAWFALAFYLSYLMTPIKEMEVWLSQDHLVSKAIYQTHKNFPPTRGDSVLLGTLHWGVEKVDRSKIGYFEVTVDPELVWDKNFNLSTPNEQLFFLDISNQLRNQEGPNKFFQNEITQPRDGLNIYNFMEGFSQYIQKRGLQFPVPEDQYYQRMKEFTESQASQIYLAQPNFGFSTDAKPKQIYAEIQVVTNTKNDTPFQQLNKQIQKWKEICADFDRQAIERNVPGLSNCHFNGGQPAAWKSTQQVLFIDSAIGMLMVVVISFIVMVVTNRNIVIAFMALIGVALIVISDIATMKLNDWTFGIAQSLSSVIFVGFSVDYVLHLSNYYINALSPSRKNRMQEAYGNIGGSIIGGAITTLVSAMSLLSAQFQLYYKFAFLISATIIFSLLSSLFFFGALAHTMGPNDKCGNTGVIFKYIFCCKCCKKFQGSPGIGNFRVELRRVKPSDGNLDFMDSQPDANEEENKKTIKLHQAKRNDSIAELNHDLNQVEAGKIWNQLNRQHDQQQQQQQLQQITENDGIERKNKTYR